MRDFDRNCSRNELSWSKNEPNIPIPRGDTENCIEFLLKTFSVQLIGLFLSSSFNSSSLSYKFQVRTVAKYSDRLIDDPQFEVDRQTAEYISSSLFALNSTSALKFRSSHTQKTIHPKTT